MLWACVSDEPIRKKGGGALPWGVSIGVDFLMVGVGVFGDFHEVG